jgi:catechol 2,3-dioxygenase-like lactoylglutathione lyase family enzyme
MTAARARAPMVRTDAPRLFRVLLSALDFSAARRFYESLLAAKGREVGGGRIYFDCGPVLLGILDRGSSASSEFSPAAEAVYFATEDLERVFLRARRLDCLEPGLLHGDPASPMGAIKVRPWGERSFYARDPSGNPLCFVDSRTMFTGTPQQVAALGGDPSIRPGSPSTTTRRSKPA